MKNFLFVLGVLVGISSCEPVKEPAPAAILGKAFVEIQTPNSNIFVGDTLRITAKFTNEKNESSTPSFSWSSSKTDIATVSLNGLVKGVKVGQTFVIAEYSNKKDTLIITVLTQNTTTVSGTNTTTGTTNTTLAGTSTTSGTNSTTSGTNTVSGTNTTVDAVVIIAPMSTMQVNGTQQLQAQVYNSASSLLAGKSVSWLSSDTAVLKTTTAGFITANKAGVATITANSEGVNSLAYAITVSNVTRMGTFTGLGTEMCNGTALLKYDGGGNLKVEFSTDFSVSAGPDLYVYLSNISSGSSVNTSGLIVAVLGSTSGARSYTVPSGTAIGTYKYVVVHCRQYAHTFGYAELK